MRSEEPTSTLSARSILRRRDNVLNARRNNEKRIKEILFKRKRVIAKATKIRGEWPTLKKLPKWTKQKSKVRKKERYEKLIVVIYVMFQGNQWTAVRACDRAEDLQKETR